MWSFPLLWRTAYKKFWATRRLLFLLLWLTLSHVMDFGQWNPGQRVHWPLSSTDHRQNLLGPSARLTMGWLSNRICCSSLVANIQQLKLKAWFLSLDIHPNHPMGCFQGRDVAWGMTWDMSHLILQTSRDNFWPNSKTGDRVFLSDKQLSQVFCRSPWAIWLRIQHSQRSSIWRSVFCLKRSVYSAWSSSQLLFISVQTCGITVCLEKVWFTLIADACMLNMYVYVAYVLSVVCAVRWKMLKRFKKNEKEQAEFATLCVQGTGKWN